MTAAALELRGVVKRYGAATALAGVDLVVAPGTVGGLVGPNGSGKTTALRVAVGLIRPDSGSAAVCGLPPDRPSTRRRLAYVPDEPVGLDELTLGEYVSLVRALHGAAEGFDARRRVLLAAFGLEGRDRTALGALSHGTRRLGSMVAAFALGAEVIVVDEATAALDPEAVVVAREAVRALAASGSAVLVATQDLHFAETACDRVHLLSRGRLVDEGEPADVCARYGAGSLEEAFLAALGRRRSVDEVRRSLAAL